MTEQSNTGNESLPNLGALLGGVGQQAATPPTPTVVLAANKGGRPTVAAAKAAKAAKAEQQAHEKVTQDDPEKPLVDLKAAPEKPAKAPAEPTTYGMKTAEYEKLSKAQKRRLFLAARLEGPNTHNYPGIMLATWRREIMLIDAGLWQRPLKTNSKSKTIQEIVG
jgi:hypothetical protein